MARRRGGHDIAGEIRGAFIRAVKIMDDDPVFKDLALDSKPGHSLSTMMQESLKEDFKGTLNALKGFVPKEAFIAAEQTTYEEWLEELEGEEDSPEE